MRLFVENINWTHDLAGHCIWKKQRSSTFFFLLIFINIILKQYLLSFFFYLALGPRFYIAVSTHLKTRTFWYFLSWTFEVFLNCFYFYSIFSKLILPSFLLLLLMRVFSFRERLIYSHVFNPMLVRRSSKKVIRDYCVPKSKYYTYNSKVFFIQYLIYWYL